MEPSGLRITQFNLLAELERRERFPPDGGRTRGDSDNRALGAWPDAQTLERDGLIVLDRDERDGRRRPVRLTAAAREAVVRAGPYWTQAHRRFAGFFGEPEMAELRATLRDIAENPQVASPFDRSVAPG
jgi:hypothetical protein